MNEINTNLLEETVKKLLAKGKGILAADESNGTADKRLQSVDVEGGEENRRRYRELFLCMDGLEDYVSGVILYDETFWQKDCSGEKTFVEKLEEKGVVPGIKVDLGAKDFPGFPEEKLTIGLDDLAERAGNYSKHGGRFAKWRAVIKIDEEKGLPTEEAVEANADALGRYARIVQEAGLVPIVEPEVLLTGPHSLETSEKVTKYVVKKVFEKLNEYRAYIPGVILKTSMVINGSANVDEASAEEVADGTVRMLLESVPENVGGVVFLSGGQTAVEATTHLDAIAEREPLPFEIAFSYARALQQPALRVWKGKDENTDLARAEFKKRLELNQLADAGDYDIAMEYLE
ncbi:fructose-bisphosphate aldolase class I [Candidatus Parcubacteria bacterium]|nr:fructose-bisphosphate aldolase class I [Candidatus Parcubacteria bacterium]